MDTTIEEQWSPPTSTDILCDSWMDMADAKKAVKIWILDRGESWGNTTQNNKTQLQLHCILSAPSIFELHDKRLVSSVLYPILHTIALPQHMPNSSSITQRGILLVL